MTRLRTRQEIDADYGQVCAQVGHKTALIQEFEKTIFRLQDELRDHMSRIGALRVEKAFEIVAEPAPVGPAIPAETI